jgi:hypothetical protein
MGRTFIPGLTTAAVAEGVLDAGEAATFSAAAAALYGDVNSTFVIWHRPVGGAGGSMHVVTSSSIGTQFAVLRSRRD